GVFHDEGALDEVEGAEALAVRELAVEEALAARDHGHGVRVLVLADARRLALVADVPVLLGAAHGLPVDLAVRVAVDDRVAVAALLLGHQRRGFAVARIAGDDLAARAADAAVDPAGVVDGHRARVFRPV